MAVDLNVMLCLGNVNAIKHVQEALTLDRHGEFLIKHVKDYVGSALVGSGDGKVVYLSFEDDSFAINGAGILARLMDGWCQTEFTQDCIRVVFPIAWATWGVPAWQTEPE